MGQHKRKFRRFCVETRIPQPAPNHPSAEFGIELLEDGALAFGDLEQGLYSIKPSAAIDLGELLGSARFRRPLHLEQIAGQIGRIAISLDRPDVQALAAGLSEYSKIMLKPTSVGIESGLFFEFAPRAGQFIFQRVDETLRHGPSAVVLLCPIGSSRVDEKDFRARTPSAI